MGSVGGSSGVAGVRSFGARSFGRGRVRCGCTRRGQAAHLASISTNDHPGTSKTVESEVPSGCTVLGGQQKLSVQKPATPEDHTACVRLPRWRVPGSQKVSARLSRAKAAALATGAVEEVAVETQLAGRENTPRMSALSALLAAWD